MTRYLRVGDWDHASPFSTCWAEGTKEVGLSVYALDGRGEPVVPEGGRSDDEWVEKDLRDRLAHCDPKYIVTGTVVGTGYDGEPLLADVEIVGRWEPT